MRTLCSIVAAAGACSSAAGVDPFADRVISYTSGLGVSGYDQPLTALGSPERYTGEVFQFPGCVTPFNSAFGTDEVVSIGGGGSLVLAFDEPVTNDPGNPFGLDFIVFGNAGFIDAGGRTGPGAALYGEGVASAVSVSADGLTWFPLAGSVDTLFPTMGYADVTDPYGVAPGLVPTDFTRPVNPAFNPANATMADLIAGYNGSGGGTAFDLSPTGLASFSFIRFVNLADGPVTFQIDAVSDVAVPAPASLAYGLCGLIFAWRRRAR